MNDDEAIWILLNMKNALRQQFMLSFEIFTRKLIKRDNPFLKNSKEYNILEEMKRLYNEKVRDMTIVCRAAKELCNVYFDG